MTHKPILYVSHITNLSDARYCAGMGVDMLGFVIDPSHADYVSPSRYQEMIGWIAGPARVLEIMSVVDMKAVTDAYKPELVHTNLTLAADNVFGDLPLIIEVEHTQYPNALALINSSKKVQYVIVNGFQESGGALQSHQHKVLISLLNPADASIAILERSGAAGLALQGTAETRPGLKDYDHLSRILEELDNA